MTRLQDAGIGQRVVAVVGLAAALVVIGHYVSLLAAPTAPVGWTGYEPLAVRARAGLDPLAQLLLWLLLVAIWVGASFFILRTSPQTSGRGTAAGPPAQPPGPSTPDAPTSAG